MIDSVAQVDPPRPGTARTATGTVGTGPPRETPAAPVWVSQLTKSYGTRPAVRDVSFEAAAGVTGILGPNGAGKTTLLRCLAGLAGWTSGEVRICGIDLERRATDARRHVGYMPERTAFPLEMRVQDYLRFVSEMKHVPRRRRAGAIDAAMEQAGLDEVRRRVVGNLSKGFRQRVGLAQSLLGDPAVLILDEPSAGLDPLNVIEFRDVIRRCARDRTVLVSTHVLPEARLLCDRVVVMSAGRVAYDGPTVAMVRAGGARRRVRVHVGGSATGDPPVVTGPQVALVEHRQDGASHVMVVDVDSEQAIGALVANLVAGGWSVLGLEPTTDTLEEAFRRAVTGGSAPRRKGRP